MLLSAKIRASRSASEATNATGGSGCEGAPDPCPVLAQCEVPRRTRCLNREIAVREGTQVDDGLLGSEHAPEEGDRGEGPKPRRRPRTAAEDELAYRFVPIG